MTSKSEAVGSARSCQTRRDLLLLAPSAYTTFGTSPISRFGNSDHGDWLSQMQRFRGATYLKEGAIGCEALDSEGRHQVDADGESWHVLLLSDGNICGCSRYTSHRISENFERLGVARSSLAKSSQWGSRLRTAVERERRNALREGSTFVEVGGWAIAENLRGSMEAIRIALATYALGTLLGGCIGLTTATARNNSASLLRRIGGHSISVDSGELPKYFDTQYNCEMEILRFDSSIPNAKFAPWVSRLKDEIASLSVVAPEPPPRMREHYAQPLTDQSMGNHFVSCWSEVMA